MNIEAAKEGGLSWIELEDLPIWRRETLLAKISCERKAENILQDRAKRDMENNRNKGKR